MSNKQNTVKYYIDPLWDTVKKIRGEVESILKDRGRDIMDASKMTASELIENAVKYGCSIEDGTGIQFELILDEDRIRILVRNKVLSQDDFENVKQHIDSVNAAENPQELYLQRLMMLMENTRISKSQLGLYRIAYEGEFVLKYDYSDSILTVTATRMI